MQCKQCSSIDFKKISDNQYQCTYCGAVQFVQGTSGPAHSQGRAREPEKRIRVRLMLSVATAMVMLGAVGLILYMRVGPGPNTGQGHNNIQGESRELSQFGEDSIEKQVPPEGAFSRVATIPDSIGNVYFVGYYKNTGTTPIRKPMVAVTLYHEGDKVASGRGYSIREVLLPSEETPVVVLVQKAPRYSSFKATHNPEPPFAFNQYTRPSMKFRDVVMRKGQYSGYEISGKLVNKGKRGVRYANIIAVLMNSAGTIIGSGTGYIKEDIIEAGDYSPFTIDITTVKGVPVSFKLDYEGTVIE